MRPVFGASVGSGFYLIFLYFAYLGGRDGYLKYSLDKKMPGWKGLRGPKANGTYARPTPGLHEVYAANGI